MPNTLVRDLAMLLILAVMWSSSFTVIKVGAEVLPPVTFAMLRVAIGALVLYGWLKIRKLNLPTEPRLWGSFFLIGLFGNGLPFVMINWGEQKIASGLAAIIIASMPLAALLLGRIFSDEVLNARRIIGVSVGFAGVVTLIGPQELLHLGDDAIRQLAVAAAALCYAIAGILVRKLPGAKPEEHGAGVLIASCAVLVPAALFADQPWALSYSAEALAAVLYLGVFPTALATILLISVIASRGVTFMSLNNYLIPVLGVLWGFLFLDEAITRAVLVALTLILVGITIAGTGPTTRGVVAVKKIEP
ncbi:MAG: EamA family transporter [Rhodospirillales bacterium]|nr:EamA family transporter [Rhodospirillales bacterium]